jgi:sulfite reductase alpha subunit-like flavoprotein
MYNVMGKFFNEIMEEMGATRVYRYGEGNAEGNKTEDDFNAWKLALWEELVQYYESHPIKKGAAEAPIKEEEKKEGPPPAFSGKQLPLVLEVNQDLNSVFDGALELVSKQHHTGKDLRVKAVRELR